VNEELKNQLGACQALVMLGSCAFLDYVGKC
jgi:hypothetical protein